MNRRELFRLATFSTTKILAASTLLYGYKGVELTIDTLYPSSDKIPDAFLDKKNLVVTSNNDISLPSSKKVKKSFELEKINLNKYDYEVLGVTHDFENFSLHKKEISDLVKNSKFVVLENLINKDYFAGLLSLCNEHNKPIVSLDNRTDKAILVETGLGALGSAVFASTLFTASKVVSRRDAIKKSSLGLAGLYLWSNSFFHRIFSAVDLPENYFLGHTVDHRNVELTSRLSQLSDLMVANDASIKKHFSADLEGDYVLVNFGNKHKEGLSHYINNPDELNYKKKFYDRTYGLIDNEKITFNYFKNDSLKAIELKK